VNVQTNYVCNHQQLDKIDASLPALDVGDKWLVSSERFGNLGLRQPFSSPLVSQRRRDQFLTL